MKKITLLFFTFLTTVLFSQTKLQYEIEQFLDENSEWVDSSVTEYTYNNAGYVTLEERSIVVDFDLEKNEKTTYVYNANNKLAEELIQEWNGTSYVNSYRSNYTYLDNGNLISVTNWEFEDNVWEQSFTAELSYTNGLITSFVSTEVYEGETEAEMTTLTYNDTNQVVSTIISVIEGDTTELDYRELRTYDANNNLTSVLGQDYEEGSWFTTDDEAFSYDANNNVITETNTYDGDSFTDVYTYDTDVLLDDLIHPFRDQTGTNDIFDPLQFVNKIESIVSEGEYRTLYVYDDEIASTDNIEEVAINVFPIPSNDFITVDLAANVIEDVTIYNSLGEEVIKTTNSIIDIKSISTGIYFLKATTDSGKTVTSKIVKN